MKKAMLFLFAFVVAMGTNVQAQSLKKLYPADAEVVITPLPFAWEKCTPYLDPVVDFTWEKGKGLPLFSYRDLNGLLKNESEEDFAYVFRHFELPAEGVELLAVAVERSYFIRHLLLVYKDGVLTDWQGRGADGLVRGRFLLQRQHSHEAMEGGSGRHGGDLLVEGAGRPFRVV